MSEKFTLAWDLTGTRLRFAMHGMWDETVMTRWTSAYRSALAGAPKVPWTVVCDMSDYPQQHEPIQRGHETLMALSAEKGMVHAAMIVPKVVLAMQMKRLAGETGAAQLFTWVSNVADAEKALASYAVQDAAR